MVLPADSALLADKQTLRRSMAERRKAVSPELRSEASRRVCDRLMDVPAVARAVASGGVVAGFAALPFEVDPAAFLAAARAQGAKVAYPRVTDARPRLSFHLADEHELSVGAFGVREPSAHAQAVSVSTFALVLLPGLAFDDAGHRLGYGGGYYDEAARLVRAASSAPLVALGFDFQIVERCPAGVEDVAVDGVVTEARVVGFGQGASEENFS